MDGLEVLGSEKREVASYDQIGCARSPYTSPGAKKGLTATPPGPGTYTPALFANELGEVRRATGLDAVHVVAHGWGGMLALDHILGGNGVDGSRRERHRFADAHLDAAVVRSAHRRQARHARSNAK